MKKQVFYLILCALISISNSLFAMELEEEYSEQQDLKVIVNKLLQEKKEGKLGQEEFNKNMEILEKTYGPESLLNAVGLPSQIVSRYIQNTALFHLSEQQAKLLQEQNDLLRSLKEAQAEEKKPLQEQQEQNDLLREQNDLLRSILEDSPKGKK